MKTALSLKTYSNKCRRKFAVAEINILRNFEERDLIQEKISRQLFKLHSLWFSASRKEIFSTRS